MHNVAACKTDVADVSDHNMISLEINHDNRKKIQHGDLIWVS